MQTHATRPSVVKSENKKKNKYILFFSGSSHNMDLYGKNRLEITFPNGQYQNTVLSGLREDLKAGNLVWGSSLAWIFVANSSEWLWRRSKSQLKT